MSLAYYIVLDQEQPGFDRFVNGKAIAHALAELDKLCDGAGLARLDSFVGQSLEEIADLLGEDMDWFDEDDEGHAWFEPDSGVEWVDRLLEAIQQSPQSLSEPEAVIAELGEYKQVLLQAQQLPAKWHLAIDL